MRLLLFLHSLLLFGSVKELDGFVVRPSASATPVSSRSVTLHGRSDVSENIDEKTEDDDGWQAMRSRNTNLIKKALKLPGRIVSKTTKRVEPGTLILVRHGESLWNANKTFTGWADPDLSPRGYREVEHAARLLLEGGYEIDVVFTSRLKRAIRSTWLLLSEMNQVYLPVFKSWRLNERMYGGLTGLSKFETAEQLGAQLVQEWRGSLNSRPPALTPSNMYWPGHDSRYRDLTSEQIPLTESLLDCMVRTQPLWNDKILSELREGKNVLVVAHANTLRGLVKTIDEISDTDSKCHEWMVACMMRSGLLVLSWMFSYTLCSSGRGHSHWHSNRLQIRSQHEVGSSQWRPPNGESNSHERIVFGETWFVD